MREHTPRMPADADSEAKFQVQRARLSAVQARSTSFRGFSEQELDTLLPFLSLIEFEDGDLYTLFIFESSPRTLHI